MKISIHISSTEGLVPGFAKAIALVNRLAQADDGGRLRIVSLELGGGRKNGNKFYGTLLEHGSEVQGLWKIEVWVHHGRLICTLNGARVPHELQMH